MTIMANSLQVLWVHRTKPRHNFRRYGKILPTTDDCSDPDHWIELLEIYPLTGKKKNVTKFLFRTDGPLHATPAAGGRTPLPAPAELGVGSPPSPFRRRKCCLLRTLAPGLGAEYGRFRFGARAHMPRNALEEARQQSSGSTRAKLGRQSNSTRAGLHVAIFCNMRLTPSLRVESRPCRARGFRRRWEEKSTTLSALGYGNPMLHE